MNTILMKFETYHSVIKGKLRVLSTPITSILTVSISQHSCVEVFYFLLQSWKDLFNISHNADLLFKLSWCGLKVFNEFI